jgi:hypothetical protein
MDEWNKGYEKGYADALDMLTLTDDEILDTFDPHFDADIEDKELIKFARAILKKAQEK